MKYYITIADIKTLGEAIEIEVPETLMLSYDEIKRGNSIEAIKYYSTGIWVTVALKPLTIYQSYDLITWIGEPSCSGKQVWPTNELMEQVTNEVSDVMDNLKIKTVHCIFYVPDEPKPIEVDLELFNGNRVVFKGMNFVIPENRKEPYVFRIDNPVPIKLSEVM